MKVPNIAQVDWHRSSTLFTFMLARLCWLIALLDVHSGWLDPLEEAPSGSGEEESGSEGAGTIRTPSGDVRTPFEERANGKGEYPSDSNGDMKGTEVGKGWS